MDTASEGDPEPSRLGIELLEDAYVSFPVQPGNTDGGGSTTNVPENIEGLKAIDEKTSLKGSAEMCSDSCETKVHILLPKGFGGEVILRDKEGQEVGRLHRAQNEHHWISQSLSVSTETTSLELALLETGWRWNPLPGLFTNHQPDPLSILVKKAEYNFIFPPKDWKKVNISIAGQIEIFLKYLAGACTSETALGHALSGLRNITKQITVQESSKEKIRLAPKKVPEIIKQMIGDTSANSKQYSKMFMVLTAFHVFCLETSLIKESIHDDAEFATFVLSGFEGFVGVSTNSIDCLPNWLLKLVRGPRGRSMMEALLLSSAKQSYEWIRQLPGILTMFDESYLSRWILSDSGLTKIEPEVAESSDNSSDYTVCARDAFENANLAQASNTKKGRATLRDLYKIIIDAAPDMKSILLVAQLNCLPLIPGALTTIQDTMKKRILYLSKMQSIDHCNLQEIWALWESATKGTVPEKEKSYLPSSSVVVQRDTKTEITPSYTLLCHVIKIIFFAKIGSVHTFPDELRKIYMEFAKDSILFPEGLEQLVFEVDRSSGYQANWNKWPEVVKFTWFPMMLPDAVGLANNDDQKTEKLKSLCHQWIDNMTRTRTRTNLGGRAPDDDIACKVLRTLDKAMGSLELSVSDGKVAVETTLMERWSILFSGMPIRSAFALVEDIQNNFVSNFSVDILAQKVRLSTWGERTLADCLNSLWKIDKGVQRFEKKKTVMSWNLTCKILCKACKLDDFTDTENLPMDFVLSMIEAPGTKIWANVLEVWHKIRIFHPKKCINDIPVKQVSFGVYSLLTATKSQTITFSMADRLVSASKDVKGLCLKLEACGGHQILEDMATIKQAEAILNDAQAACAKVKLELEQVKQFVVEILEIVEGQTITQNVRRLLRNAAESLKDTTILNARRKIGDPWKSLESVYDVALKIYPLITSGTFKIALTRVNPTGEADAQPIQTIDQCLQKVEQGLVIYKQMWKPFFVEEKITLAHARYLVGDSKLVCVEREFRLAHDDHQALSGTAWGTVEDENCRNLQIFADSLMDTNSSEVGVPNLLLNLEKIWSLCEGDLHDTLTELSSRLSSDSTGLEVYSSAYMKARTVLQRSCPCGWDLQDFIHLLTELSKIEECVKLVEEIGDEDVRMLSDAVEDSDTLIREDAVSSFVLVKSFISDLSSQAGQTIDCFVCRAGKCLNDSIAPHLNMVNHNIFALRAMYEQLSDVGDLAKEVIMKSLCFGKYEFKTDDGGAAVTDALLTLDNMHKTTYSLVDLQDFRSKALLLADSQENLAISATISGSSQPDFESFVKAVDMCTSIFSGLSILTSIGHFCYFSFAHAFVAHSSSELLENLDDLNQKINAALVEWNEHLNDARLKHYPLCFLKGCQIRELWILAFQRRERNERMNDVMCGIAPSLLQDHDFCLPRGRPVHRSEDRVIQLGEWLVECLTLIPHRSRCVHESHVHPSNWVGRGQILITACEDENSFNAILSLYASSGSFPEPGELLICDQSTDAEDVSLMLLRCLMSCGTHREGKLFCLANIENLRVETQVSLIECVNKYKKSLELEGCCLAIVSGSKESYFIDQFRSDVQETRSLTDDEVGELLLQEFDRRRSRVLFILSDSSGMGKTEKVVDMMSRLSDNEDYVKIPISGPLDFCGIVKESSMYLACGNYKLVHLDISSVGSTKDVDNFIFLLLVLNQVSTTESTMVLKMHEGLTVAIEIANSVCDDIWNGLNFGRLAPRINTEEHAGSSSGDLPAFGVIRLVWDLEAMKVDNDPMSDIQIVCRHLHALQAGTFAGSQVSIEGSEPALGTVQCRELLWTHFCQHIPFPSFQILTNFMKILSRELKSLSLSAFFLVETLHWAGASLSVRQELLSLLLQLTRHFVIESSSGAFLSQSMQAALLEVSREERMVQRVEKIVNWEENKHVMIKFNQSDGHSITPVYRSIQHVSQNIQNFIRSQNGSMPDYATLTHAQLLETLKLMLGVPRSHHCNDTQYVLTPDNLLKMILIHLRVKANVPVVIIGETGCGKTSLIQFLASLISADFSILNVHAGTTRQNIRDFTGELETKVMESGMEAWGFFDEINTCDELGMINDVVCHRQIDGRRLHPMVNVMAACNPYRLKDVSLPTAGYELSKRGTKAELVYSVHPLPESMLGLAWDYGQLNQESQKLYLINMLMSSNAACLQESGLFRAAVDVLLMAQEFVRRVEAPWSTSLRDFRRWIQLFLWFRHKLNNGPKAADTRKNTLEILADIMIYRHSKSTRVDRQLHFEVEKRSIVLALAITHYMRLGSQELRESFREQASAVFQKHKVNLSARDFNKILNVEQCDYIARMDLPRGTAVNEALKENIFAGLVCILNKLPLFLVGKPGCSKSMSLQLIYSNLKGPDSREELFRTFPKVVFVSFQGSESSTSDGILKVFERAHRFLKPDDQILPVVVLDEIGLAEVSPHNPLKVLHSLLEPGKPKDELDVAVVGISNWALDAAKMNRAVVLSRPDPSLQDLQKTAVCIQESIMEEVAPAFRFLNALNKMAEYYHTYVLKQPKENFHGLRDFYSFIKSLSEKARRNDGRVTDYDFCMTIVRSFGGLEPQLSEKVVAGFLSSINKVYEDYVPVHEVVRDAVQDPTSRHVMLITQGHLHLDILKNFVLQEQNPVVIYGSPFSEDLTDDYSYRVLSRIKVHIREGHLLILKDLDRVYGALYDMLNQNYTVQGTRRYCRIALGPHSNPMCNVHPNFRCLVLMEEDHLHNVDPPFLNRFEKQFLSLDFLLDAKMSAALKWIETWVAEISKPCEFHPGSNSCFNQGNMFARLTVRSLKSLVLKSHQDLSSAGKGVSEEMLIQACTSSLSRIAFLDGVVRAKWSSLAKVKAQEVDRFCSDYFKTRPKGLEALLDSELGLCEAEKNGTTKSARMRARQLLVMSERPAAPETLRKLEERFEIKRFTLQTLTSEKYISDILERFFFSEDTKKPQLLFFETSDRQDSRSIQFLQFLANQYQQDYASRSAIEFSSTRHICILVHITRSEVAASECVFEVNFLSDWEHFLVTSLDGEKPSKEALLFDDIPVILSSEAMPIKDVIHKVLFRGFLCQKYPQGSNSVEHIRMMVEGMRRDEELLESFCSKILSVIPFGTDLEPWQKQLACDQVKMSSSGGLIKAAEIHIEEIILVLVAKHLYILENASDLNSYFYLEKSYQEIWRHLFSDEDIVSPDSIIRPTGLEFYQVGLQRNFQLPFAKTMIAILDTHKQDFLSWQGPIEELAETILSRLEMSIHSCFFDFLKTEPQKYIEDFVLNLKEEECPGSIPFDLCSSVFKQCLAEFKSVHSLDGLFLQDSVLVHIMWWSQGPEIRSLLKMVGLCPKLDYRTPYLRDGGKLTHCAIVQQVLRVNKQEVLRCSTAQQAERWLVKWRITSMHIHRQQLSSLNAADATLLGNLDVIGEFISSNAKGGDDAILEIIRVLGAHIGTNYKTADGIHFPLDLAEKLRTHDAEGSDGGLSRVVSSLLVDCMRRRYLNLQLFSIILNLVLQEQVPQDFLPVMIMAVEVATTMNTNGSSCSNTLNSRRKLLCHLHKDETVEKEDYMPVLVGCVNACSVNSRAAAIAADALQIRIFDDFIHETVGAEFLEDGFLENLGAALNIISNHELYSTFRVVTSTALIRSVLEVLPSVFQVPYAGSEPASGSKTSSSTHKKDKLSLDLKKILPKAVHEIISFVSSSLLSEPQLMHLQLYLLKVLRLQGLTFPRLASVTRMLNENKLLFSELQWNPLEANRKIAFNPLATLPGFNEALAKIKSWMDTPTSQGQLTAYVKNASTDSGLRRACISAVITSLYFTRCWRELNEEEMSLVAWIKEGEALKKWPKTDRVIVTKFATNSFSTKRAEMTQTMEADTVQKIVIEVHLLVVFLSGEAISPLAFGENVQSHIHKSFLPSVPSDVTGIVCTAVKNAEGSIRRYKCSKCPYIFAIGNCGHPNQAGRCPECHTVLGPGSIALEEINEAANRGEATIPGYIPPGLNESHNMAERRLTPLAFRVLRLWLHTMLSWSWQLDFWTGDSLLKTLKIRAGQLDEYCREDWNVVERLIPDEAAGERGVLLMNALIQQFSKVFAAGGGVLVVKSLRSNAERQTWEDSFMKKIFNPLMKDVARTVSIYQQELGLNQDSIRLEALIDESAETRFLPKLLRARGAVSMSKVQASFLGDVHNALRYPVLAHLFKSSGDNLEGQLLCVHHVFPLMDWMRRIQKTFNHKISRDLATRMTIAQMLEDHPELEESFVEFANAWNSIRHITTRFQCHEIGEIPEMHRETILSIAMYEERQQGVYMAALIAHAVAVQNDFLQVYFQILQRIGPDEHEEPIDALFVKREHIIGLSLMDMERMVKNSGFVAWNMEYGTGRHLQVDFASLQNYFIKSLAGARVVNLAGVEGINYSKEAFQKSFTLISDIRSMCDQASLTEQESGVLRDTIEQQAEFGLSELLSAVEIVMCVMKRTKCFPDTDLDRFTSIWIYDDSVSTIFSGDSALFKGVRAGSIVGLYELIEELLCETSLEAIHPDYKAELGADLRQMLSSRLMGGSNTSKNAMDHDCHRIRPTSFLKVISVFAFRYLLGGGEHPQPHHPLCMYICDPRCVVWPPGSLDGVLEEGIALEDRIEDILPNDLLNAHTHALMGFLQSFL